MNKVQTEDTVPFEWLNPFILAVMVPDDKATLPSGTDLVLPEE